MKLNLNWLFALVTLAAYQSFGADALDSAKTAFRNSENVKTEIRALEKQGYTRMEELQAVTLSGGCGFAGCDQSILVVQRQSTPGANTQTLSVQALVSVPAVGLASVRTVKVSALQSLELAWTSDADSVQATVKKLLFNALKSGNKRVEGNYAQVIVHDKNAKLVCQEQKAAGMIQIQKFRCGLVKK